VTKTETREFLYVEKLTANIFTRISYKINFSNKKDNNFLLPIDILKDNVKKDLLQTANKNVEKTYGELLSHNLPNCDMEKNSKVIFLQLLQKTCDDFLAQQYGCTVQLDSARLDKTFYAKNLVKEFELLFEIPFYTILNPKATSFLLIFSPVYSSASENFLEALIDNLVIEIANCIAYYLILNFSFLYAFRQTLYRSKFLSLRNFERFKNNLIWEAKLKISLKRPTLIYSSCYNIFLLRTTGICSRSIYANRSHSLKALSPLPLFIITFIEFKDFLFSRLDEAVYFLSKAVRFTLTSVIGQFIGLIWRGVIEGLKNKDSK